MSQYQISILVTIYNVVSKIVRCTESLSAQSFNAIDHTFTIEHQHLMMERI